MKSLLTAFFTFAIISTGFAASLDQMIGQMVLIGVEGKSANTKSMQEAIKDIKDEKVGGILILGANIRTQNSVFEMTKTLQNASPNKLFITIDQEGGRIRRLKPEHGAPNLPSAQDIVAIGQEAAHQKYFDTATYLKKMGFNVNFGPVLDMNRNKNNPIIGRLGRSYGADVKNVAQFGYMFVDAHRQAGVLSAIKHFPGHGSSRADTHKGFVDVSKSWGKIELEPFKYLIDWEGADMVMAAHVVLDQMDDGNNYPASLSHQAITGALRNQLGFDGVVVSDDLAMGAITKNYLTPNAIVRFINAGGDLVMVSYYKNRKRTLGSWVHAIIKQAVIDGKISRERIEQSYARIMKLKAKI